MNLRIADLHTHSTCSDGLYRPSEVVGLVATAGIGIVSLTDHDTMDGLAEAESAARRLGVEFVPGIEISALHEVEECHILGYFVCESGDLQDYVRMMKDRRSERLREIIERLRGAGVGIELSRVEAYADGLVTRAHVARCLVEDGHVDSIADAFSRYLGAGCVGYVSAAAITVSEAIDLIHDSGGCASLAHPGEWMSEDAIEAMTRMGLDAVEVVHPSHDGRLVEYYRGMARSMGLLLTGGSDLHVCSDDRPGVPGSYCVSSEDVDALRRRAPGRAS